MFSQTHSLKLVERFCGNDSERAQRLIDSPISP